MKQTTVVLLALILLVGVVRSGQYSQQSLEDMDVRARAAFSTLKEEYPGVSAYRDDIGRATRIYGRAFSSGNTVEQAAESFRVNHAEVFGIEPSDLVSGSFLADGRSSQPLMRDFENGGYKFMLMYYRQQRGGVPVYGAELRLLVRNEPGNPVVLAVSTLKNIGDFTTTTKSVSAAFATSAAKAAIPSLNEFSEPRTVIWAGNEDSYTEPRLAVTTIGSNDSHEKWLLVLDAETGELIYQEDQVIFEDVVGTATGNATEGSGADICGPELPRTLPYLNIESNVAGPVQTDTVGNFTVPYGGTGSVTVSSNLDGEYFDVFDFDTIVENVEATVTPPGPADLVFNSGLEGFTTAQVNGYLHANVVRDYTLLFNEFYPVVQTQTDFPVWVNRDDGYCPGNAWYNGNSINFCRGYGGYPNTAFSTIIHHEYGHHLVAMAGSGQGQYGEGMSDVMGMLIFDEAGTGDGFFGSCGAPLRTGDNNLQYPCNGEIHYCGQVLTGCVWDTRELLKITYPDTYRQILSNLAINAVLLHTGTEITPQITIDYLTLDDDDANILNGTPHSDEICEGFAAHSMDCPNPPHVVQISNEFSDDFGGDGDGIFEPGEAIQVFFTVQDNQIADVFDFSATLLADDATLIISDASSFLGILPDGATVDNTGDPLAFQIPGDYIPRQDSFFIALAWDSDVGLRFDTMVVAMTIGAPSLLLVDDDNNDNTDQYFTEVLDRGRIVYDQVNAAFVSIDSALLSKYNVVLWGTGDYRTSPLSTGEMSAITTYLNAGGSLFLTGQGVAKQLSTANPSLLNNYLKADYIKTQLIPILGNEPGTQLFTPADSVAILGSGGASNQTNPDHIQPTTGGVPELIYYNQPDYGAVSYSGAYKSVFFAFGFESIVNGDSRWTPRDTVLKNILGFFGYEVPVVQPKITLLTIPDEDSMHVINHVPELIWRYVDPNGFVQQEYQIQVSTDNDWEIIEMWDTGPVSSADTSVTYDGIPLLDNSRYYVRVRAFNGVVWSNWYVLPIRLNSVPTPFGLSPRDKVAITALRPQFTHDNAKDLEFDNITYDYEVYSDSALTNLVISETGHPAGSQNQTNWIPDENLPGPGSYFWRARAFDNYEQGLWSEVASFNLTTGGVQCGDASADGFINIGDAIYVINYVFSGGPQPSLTGGDAKCDGTVNIGDAVYLINYVFSGGPEPCATCP